MFELTMYQPVKTSNNTPTMFDLCRQVTPYLDGKFQQFTTLLDEKNWLVGNRQDYHTIQSIYQQLQLDFPDAGNAYWMTRTWDLLCWQPVYIAFIAIYGLQQLPDFSQFKQQYQHHSVMGFVFQSDTMMQGEVATLIPLAASQLSPLLEHYRTQLDTFSRCRPGYVKRLLADLVLDSLIKVRHAVEGFSDDDVQQHAQLWLSALNLPKHAFVIEKNKPMIHIRTSCCLTYKANNSLCANCPKANKSNQQ